MEGIGLGLKEAFKYTFIAILIIVSFMMVYFVNTDYNDKFDITINNQELTARYDSEYVKYFLKRHGGSNYNRSVQNNTDFFNKIQQSSSYILSVKEYEAYDRFGHRDSYTGVGGNQELREVFDGVDEIYSKDGDWNHLIDFLKKEKIPLGHKPFSIY